MSIYPAGALQQAAEVRVGLCTLCSVVAHGKVVSPVAVRRAVPVLGERACASRERRAGRVRLSKCPREDPRRRRRAQRGARRPSAAQQCQHAPGAEGFKDQERTIAEAREGRQRQHRGCHARPDDFCGCRFQQVGWLWRTWPRKWQMLLSGVAPQTVLAATARNFTHCRASAATPGMKSSPRHPPSPRLSGAPLGEEQVLHTTAELLVGRAQGQ